MSGDVPKPLLTSAASTILERILDEPRRRRSHRRLPVGQLQGGACSRSRSATGAARAARAVPDGERSRSATPARCRCCRAGRAATCSSRTPTSITGVDYAAACSTSTARTAGRSRWRAVDFTDDAQVRRGAHARRGVLDGFEEKPELTFLCNAGMYIVDRADAQARAEEQVLPDARPDRRRAASRRRRARVPAVGEAGSTPDRPRSSNRC